jgi:hypothetical protein
MARDFTVRIGSRKKPRRYIFKGKDCEIKDKPALVRLGITRHVKETIECGDYEITRARKRGKKSK